MTVTCPTNNEYNVCRSSMAEVLDRFDQWLARFGKRYVHLDSGDDDFQGFIIDAEQVAATIE